MRNFISKILGGATAARLFSRPSATGALARERLPFLLLLAALAAAPLLEMTSGRFGSLRDFIDGQSMTLASNLSPEHRFLMFFRQYTGADGELLYDVYHRFPIGTYLLLKAVIVPFGDSASAQIFAARLLTAALFFGAGAFAYLGLRRLTNQPWIALAATLPAFCSYHALVYGDMISSEANSLLGMMLTFHGMTIFVQEGRLRQLLVKAFAAILLNWTVMALLLPFTALGLASAIFRAIKEESSSRFADKTRAALAAVVSSRYLWLGAASLLFCALVMGFNLANEYIALGGEVPLLDLPSAQSLLRRTTIVEGINVAWLPLIELQLERIGGVSLPYLVLPWLGHNDYGGSARDIGFWVAVAVSAAGLVGLAFTRYKLPMASLMLAGWVWALGVRGSSIIPPHEFEALYHIGVPLVALSTVLTIISRRIKSNAIGAAAAAALIVFGVSILQFARFAYDEDPSIIAANSDLEAIGKITNGASVCVGPMKPGSLHAINYYLSGSIINSGFNPCAVGPDADRFIIEPTRMESGALLTPRNRMVFLYDARRLSEPPREAALRELSSREPVIRSRFSIYLDEDTLIYAKEPCSDSDMSGHFVYFRPVNNADERKPGNFYRFTVNERGARLGNACLARVILPDYPIERVHVGQDDDEGDIWSAFFVLDDMVYRAASAKAALEEPDARAYFNLHLQENRLLFLRDPCETPDADGRFFADVAPMDDADLPPEREEYGFDSLDFSFDERGAFFDGKCAAIADLPAYPIKRVRAGQSDDGALWRAFFVLDDAVYRAAVAEAARSEPDARGRFDLHLQDDSLLFLKDPCETSDADARFFVHAHPVDRADLSPERRRYGFDNLNFGLDEQGAIFDGKCAAIADLPAYSLERIRFGQFDGDVEIWGEVFVLDDAAYRSAFAEAALSEPVARNHFDLYLQDDRLLFIREPCGPSDANARFFVHVHPVDGDELPRERRQYGFDNLDFRFDQLGVRIDGKCAAIADLPAYPIERIRVGQIGDEGVIWQASLAPGERG